MFELKANFSPTGDQPGAIDSLIKGLNAGSKNQVLLGVTGSGKTFTMANVIKQINKPTLIMAHNKTLAAQLYEEMKGFFSNNAVEYFVSYYDYYQPEAYLPHTDIYIEKDAQINDRIDLLRHRATRSLMEREDVVVVSSVSCIYGLGSPHLYLQMSYDIKANSKVSRSEVMRKIVELQYTRNDLNFIRGTFRARGDNLDIFPSHYQDMAWRISFWGNNIEIIKEFDPLTGKTIRTLDSIKIFANSHYITPQPTLMQAIELIKEELQQRVYYLKQNNKLVEAQRLEQKTNFDIEMIMSTGSCKGIENYSRYLSGGEEGQPPPTLFEYFPQDALLFIDESHVTLSQIGAMYNGDKARKTSLIEYGFRLPSALDNRPLKFTEWDAMRPQTIFVSATPGVKELEYTKGKFVEQIIRPTGLLDPICKVKPAQLQVDDLLEQCKIEKQNEGRVLVTTLTKKMAESLTSYLVDIGINAVYIHSDVTTLERIEIIRDLRLGKYDVLVGINLLREGLDIPECTFIAILDADKEGFLRSETSLVQTIGRAARNVNGRVILYADKITGSIKRALNETQRRRDIQHHYNQENNITPVTIIKKITDMVTDFNVKKDHIVINREFYKNPQNKLKQLRKEMLQAADNLEFETAAKLRDNIIDIEQNLLQL